MAFYADDKSVYLYIFERGENWSSYRPRIANEGVHLD